MPTLPNIPTFAIVGRSNEGKTTLMATLTENDRLKISPIPGETTVAKNYPLRFDRSEIHFWDTPGFQNTARTHQWFSERVGGRGNLAEEFIREFEADPKFKSECEIFKTLSKGAAVIYLVDASHNIRKADQQQLEILRLCGNPRIGVVYSKKAEGKFVGEWNRLFDRELNTRREFNAHHATFSDRRELLLAVGNVIPEWGKIMREAVEDLEATWKSKKRDLTVEALLKLLGKTLEIEVLEPLPEGSDRGVVKKAAEEKLKDKVRELERKYRESVRRIFAHSSDHWDIDETYGGDLFSEEVWRILGMTKGQLTVAGAAIGAIGGGVIDAFTGGTSFLIGTLIGGVTGATIAWMSAEKIATFEFPRIRMPRMNLGPLHIPSMPLLPGGSVGGGQVRASVTPQSKLNSILIDRGLLYAKLASQWSHGRVAPETKLRVDLEHDGKSITRNWSLTDEVRQLATFLGQLAREPARRNAETLREARKSMKTILARELDKLLV